MTLSDWATDALAVLLPVRCAGCGAADRAMCAVCSAALRPRPELVGAAGLPLPVSVALDYSGVVARVLGALKENGRTDALRFLAPAMAEALAASPAVGPVSSPHARGVPPPLLVTIPSARPTLRRRGFRPVDSLVRRAGHRLPARPLLRQNREIADQAGLTASARRSNLHEGLTASPAVAGLRVVLVDDVLTTGATLREAHRALSAAGAEVAGAVCLAHTRKQQESLGK